MVATNHNLKEDKKATKVQGITGFFFSKNLKSLNGIHIFSLFVDRDSRQAFYKATDS